MSELVLSFYLDFFAQKDVEAFKKVDVEKLLYSEISGSDTEGGGRTVFAVNGNTFEIPETRTPDWYTLVLTRILKR